MPEDYRLSHEDLVRLTLWHDAFAEVNDMTDRDKCLIEFITDQLVMIASDRECN